MKEQTSMHVRPWLVAVLLAPTVLTVTCGPTHAAANRYDLRKMTLVYSVLGKVRKRYVDPTRVRPQKMLKEALNRIQRDVAEVIVWNRGADTVEVQVDSARRKFDLREVRSPWALTAKLKEILGFIQDNLRPDTKRKEVEYAVVDGILSTLDPHSVLMRPTFFQNMQVATSGTFGGLGIEISICSGVLTIRRPLKHTPAWNTRMKYGRTVVRVQPADQSAIVHVSGRSTRIQRIESNHPATKLDPSDTVVRLKAGDQIVGIENESTVNMTLNDAVKRLRGKPESDVVIWIKRTGWKASRPFLIRRDEIKVPSVTARRLDGSVGYLRIMKFQATTAIELWRSLGGLMARGPLKGLVIDLRDNHGGLLDQAVRVADTFVNSGTLVSTVGFAGRQRREIRAVQLRSKTELGRLPLVVLVNGESASAAEIVAAALKHLNRAVIMGQNTFGKGSVQVIFKTPGKTGLKLTVSQWFAPGNFSVQAVGLTPDIKTVPVRLSAGKRLKYFTVEKDLRKERDLTAALAHAKIVFKEKPFLTLHFLKAPVPKHARGFACRFCGQAPDYEPPPNPDIFVEDFEVRMAKELLQAVSAHRRLEMLAAARPFFNKVISLQQATKERRFRTLGIDWSLGQAKGPTARLTAQVSVGRAGRVQAGEQLTITAKVTNSGPGTVHRLRAETLSTNPLLRNLEFFFGKVPPGHSRQATVNVRIPKGFPTQSDTLKLKFVDQFGHAPPPAEIMVHILGRNQPRFAYAYHLTEGPGSNGDGILQVGEGVRLHLTVRNIGQGPTQEGYAQLADRSGGAFFVKTGRFDLSGLGPGKSRSMTFSFVARARPPNGLARIRVSVRDCVMHHGVAEKLVLKIWPKDTRITTIKGLAALGPNAPSAQVPLKLCPDAGCTTVARALRPASFEVRGSLAGWLMVRLSRQRTAFVRASELAVTRTGRKARPRYQTLWEVVPPRISVRLKSHVVQGPDFALKGEAFHPDRIADLFVRVTNIEAKVYDQKVFYASNSRAIDPRKLGFQATVPLKPGKNIVEVVARVNERITSTHMTVVLRR